MNTNELLTQLTPYIMGLIVTSVGALAYVGGQYVKRMLVKFDLYDSFKLNKEIVNASVRYVEQVYKALDGAEKFDKALEKATEILNSKGISVGSDELEALIEQAVFQFSDGFKSESSEITIDSNGATFTTTGSEGISIGDLNE